MLHCGTDIEATQKCRGSYNYRTICNAAPNLRQSITTLSERCVTTTLPEPSPATVASPRRTIGSADV